MSNQPPAYTQPQTAGQPATVPEDSSETKALRFAKVLVWLVYAYFMITVIILTLAFFLQLFNASSDAAFTEWVYRSAQRAMEPFRGIFPSATADNGSVIDFAVLFAIIVYGIIAMLVHSGIEWIDRKILQNRADARYQAQQAQQAQIQARQAQIQAQQAAQAQQAQPRQPQQARPAQPQQPQQPQQGTPPPA